MTTYIVDFKQGTSESQIQEFLTQRGLSISTVFDRLGLVYQVTSTDPALLTGANDPSSSQIIEHFVNDSDQELSLLGVFEVPQPNYAQVAVDPSNDENWWKVYSLTGSEWDTETKMISRKGTNSNVYVMDSGIADSHPDFVGANIVKLYSVTGEFADNNGHGTAIASLISGRRCGVTDACVKVVKVFDPNIPLYQSTLLNAMNAILTDYFNNNGKTGVVNMSWTIPKNTLIESKIQTLIDAGLYVVCAAGNNGMPIENVTPASMTDVLTVGAYNQDFEPCDFSNYQASSIAVSAGFSNFGEVDGWAPGCDIIVADSSSGGFSVANGTSVAAAITSASLAYNLSPIIDANGLVYGPIVNDLKNKTVLRNMAFTDRPLLILDPNQYDESSNRIVGFSAFQTKNYPAVLSLRLRQGQQNAVPLFRNQSVKSIAYDSNAFPSGLTLEPGGLLIGDPVIDFQGKKSKVVETEMTVTFTDDTTKTVPIQMAIFASDFDETQVSPDDPILEFTTANLYVCFLTTCGIYACGSWWCYDVLYPKYGSCICFGN